MLVLLRLRDVIDECRAKSPVVDEGFAAVTIVGRVADGWERAGAVLGAVCGA